MNPQTILYAITIIGGAALAIYTTYKQYQSQYENGHSYSYDDDNNNRRRRKSRSFSNRRNDDCIICLTTLEQQQISKTECGHIFHRTCLMTWLNLKKQCPICRSKVLTI